MQKVLKYFESNDETTKYETNFSTAISLFPDGGCRSEDRASTMSKRKTACKLLKRIQDNIGFDMFLLCSFTFSPTALYEIKNHDLFLEQIQQKITISSKFSAVASKYKATHQNITEGNCTTGVIADHRKVVQSRKRKFADTELGGGELDPQMRRIREEDKLSDLDTAEPTSGPMLSDAPLTGKVYKLGVLNAFRLLAVTRVHDLDVQLTIPDSEHWPFVTFRCNPGEVMRLSTELEQIM
ncbi:hypothetical protein LX36DRAFT_685926 [Colletotrichum falcatum]|nr:hypothetical protein LX36DRAFT_685926 [Colletotrichum falcatum]